MRKKVLSVFLLLTLVLGFGGTGPVLAEDALAKASSAVSNIMFDYEADEFASFSVQESGFVEITFAKNTPDALYSEMLNKLQNHPDIKGVLAGKTGPVCPLF
ncbi:MAG: hypothetical protein R6X06_00880 [Gammaproteobacteria bacterium]